MDTKLIVTHHGVAREISLEEALQQQTYKAALAGDRKARREVLKWMMKREAWMKKHPAKAAAPVITNYRSPDPSNADSAIQLLAIAAINPSHAGYGQRRAQLLLEPLAVQFALQRRRGGESLTDKERNEIRRCTRDADSLHWPRGTDA